MLNSKHTLKKLSNSYSALKLLKKNLKGHASYQTRRHLVDSVILFTVEYCNVILEELSKYQKQRINKPMQVCAGLVKCKYGQLSNVVDLKCCVHYIFTSLFCIYKRKHL